MVLVLGLILSGFILGAVTIVGLEAIGVLLIIKRLNKKIERDEAKIASRSLEGSPDLDPQQSLDFSFNKQGLIWVLEPDKTPKGLPDKAQKEQKRKKEYLEVSPVRKYGKIRGQSLVLKDTDGPSQTTIQLKGCTVEAVSATNLCTRKWAKKFPIKLESKDSIIYNGSKTFYMYLDTSWEKESWCKALRLASCDDKEKLDWFSKLRVEFHSYVTSLTAGYPSFMKPSVGYHAEPMDFASKSDASSSKVRQFWKKISKKTSKIGLDNRSAWISLSGREDRKNNEKFRPCQDVNFSIGSVKTASTAKGPKGSGEENAFPPLPPLSHSGSQSNISVISDAELDEKFGVDEGTLCWNLLISRLFFDVKGNTQIKRSVQARIQRTLSGMRTPSYMGEVICTDINMGNLPPFINGTRVLPMEMNEVWALEVDIEYSGGALLEIETRLEVHELDRYSGMPDSDIGTSSVEDVSSDLLEGFEYFGRQMNLSEKTSDVLEPKEEGGLSTDGPKSTKNATSSSSSGSKWKCILNSIAKQVSQVPLSLAIRVACLRGTLRFHIKPPPSDQLWYSFTSMPDIDFNLESSVGDHKVTSGHIALFLINRFKAAIRETLVLPNCENITIPWMLAEKNDWVPRNVAPFIWLNQESGNDSLSAADQQADDAKRTEASMGTLSDCLESKQQNMKVAECGAEPTRKSVDSLPPAPSSANSLTWNSSSSEELRRPLLQNEKQETVEKGMNDVTGSEPSTSRSLILLENNNNTSDVDDTRPKKMGRKERMLDLRKKMGEKLEEKRRHIEEKSRNIVEKMRGPREGQT